MGTLGSLKGIVGSMKSMSQAYATGFERSSASLSAYLKNVELALRATLAYFPLPETRPAEPARATAIIIGSDTGLVGRFNKSLLSFVDGWMRERHISQESVDSIVCGRALGARFDGKPSAFFNMPRQTGALALAASEIIIALGDRDFIGTRQSAVLFFNKKREGAFRPEAREILPIDLHTLDRIRKHPWPSRNIPMTYGDAAKMLSSLLRQYLFLSVYRALSASLAAEHFARAAAMSQAEDNIEEHLDTLSSEYRTRRQEEITSELIDVVTGFKVISSAQ
jgi:F-type H+-transporting ATPase subunit gamma